MKTTISTHNGSSFSLGHNRRDPKYTSKVKHIDLGRKHENWVDVPIREAYTWLFGEAMREYNAKQTREDRKIADYYRKIQADSRKHVSYEMIIAVGSRENPIPEEIGHKIMREYVENWKERNPNLFLYGAYYHADEEGVPHVHCDYIPVANGFKRGMETQTALTKALEQQGFEHKGNKATCQIQWEKSENQYLEGLCEGYGIGIEHPMAGKGVEHIHYTTYKAKKELEEVQRELDHVKNSLEHGKKEVKKVEKRLSGATEQLQMNELCLAETEEEIDANMKQIGSSRRELQELQDKKAEIKEQVQGAFDVVATMQSILDRQRQADEELEEREKRLKAFEKSLKERETLISEREQRYEEDVEIEIYAAKQEQERELLQKFKNAINKKVREVKSKAQEIIDTLKERLAHALEMNRFLQDKLEEHGIEWSAYDYEVWNRKVNHPAEEYQLEEREHDDFER